jgi:large subunit ribosomal protein L21
MYAVIATGGKQERVEVGQQIEVELLRTATGEVAQFPAVLVVDGETVFASRDELAGTVVSGRVLGSSAGPKITGFTYKAKANQRHRYGHRQHYTTVEITEIATAAISADGLARSEG